MEGKMDRCEYQCGKTGGCDHAETQLIAIFWRFIDFCESVLPPVCVCQCVFVCVQACLCGEDVRCEMRYLPALRKKMA